MAARLHRALLLGRAAAGSRLAQARLLSSSVQRAAPTTKLFIDNELVESSTADWIPLCNPATNEVVTMVPKSTQAEMQRAVASCKVGRVCLLCSCVIVVVLYFSFLCDVISRKNLSVR